MTTKTTPEEFHLAVAAYNDHRRAADLRVIENDELSNHISMFRGKDRFVKLCKVHAFPYLIETAERTTLERNVRKLKKSDRKGIRRAARETAITHIKTLVENDITRLRGSKTEVRCGFVYIVINPVYPGWLKIGSTIDLPDRLKTFQIYDPRARFSYAFSEYCNERVAVERVVHARLAYCQGEGEWFETSLVAARKCIKRAIIAVDQGQANST